MDEKDKTLAVRLFGEFWDAYRAATTRFRDLDVAGRWWKLSLAHPQLTASIAAGWARLGYLPEEAEPLIRDGITPATVREMERHAEQQAGGRDELAAQRIAQMVETGEIVDPARVIRVQDPTDPTREIIAVRDEEPGQQ